MSYVYLIFQCIHSGRFGTKIVPNGPKLKVPNRPKLKVPNRPNQKKIQSPELTSSEYVESRIVHKSFKPT